MVDPRGTCADCTAANFTVTYGYDLDGNRTSVTDQLGHTTAYAYDPVGHVSSVTTAKDRTTSYGYDDDGRLTSVTAPDNGVTAYAYNADGTVATKVSPRGSAAADPADYTTSYSYDAAGRVTDVVDGLGRKRSLTYTPDGMVARIVTARGNASTAPASGTITFSYDELGRLVGTAFGDGAPSVTYGYDRASRRATMTDAAGTQTYGYDPDGRTSSIARNGATWTYGYNDDGSIRSRTRPDQSVETWAYDKSGRATSVVTPAGSSTYTYDPDGNLTSSTLPNGTTETQTWDPAGFLATIGTSSGTSGLVSQTIARDAANNPTQIDVNRGGASETRSYLYDANERLQGVCYAALSSCTDSRAAEQSWTYDLDGNRTTEKHGTSTGTTTTYTYDATDRLTSTATGGGTTPYTYDADGNLTSDGTVSYTYDLANRVTSTRTGTSTPVTWTRDGDGNLLAQTQGSDVTTYGWDLLAAVPQLATVAAGGSTTSYRYDPLGRASTLTSGTTNETIAHDSLGGVSDLLSSAGMILRSYDYTPFGTSRTAIGAPTTPSGLGSGLGYAGMLVGPNSTYATRDRTYDTTTGRWTGTDPIAPNPEAVFDSPYTYVGNQPTTAVDPLGDFWQFIAAPAIGAVVGGVIGAGAYAIENGGHIDAGDMGKAAFKGAVIGAVAGFAGAVAGPEAAELAISAGLGEGTAAVVGGAVAGAASGAVTSALTDALDPCADVSTGGIVEGGAIGMLTGGLSDAVGSWTIRALTKRPGWVLPETGGGATIGRRWYTEHALERMAPDTPSVRATLERRAMARAQAAGLKPGTREFAEWMGKNGPDPRGIPPMVVEAEIANPG